MQCADEMKWYLDHPEKLNKYENTTLDERQTVFDVYLDLCEDKCWSRVEVKYSNALKKIYLTGKVNENELYQTVLPVKGESNLSLAEIEEVLHNLKDGEKLSTITLAITGSIIVYYNVGEISPTLS